MKSVAQRTERLYKAPMNKQLHIRSEDDIVAAFGSRKKLADWLHISPQAVCNWFIEIKGVPPSGIPAGYQYRIHLWATYHGYVLHPVTFGLQDDGRPISKGSSKVNARAA